MKKLTPEVFQQLVNKTKRINAVNAYYNKVLAYKYGIINTEQAALENPLIQRVDKLNENLVGKQQPTTTSNLMEKLNEIQTTLKNMPAITAPPPPPILPALAAPSPAPSLMLSGEEDEFPDVTYPSGASYVSEAITPSKEIILAFNKQKSRTLVDLQPTDNVGRYKLGEKYYNIKNDSLIQEETGKEYKLTKELLNGLTSDRYSTSHDNSQYLDLLVDSDIEYTLAHKRGSKSDKERFVLDSLVRRRLDVPRGTGQLTVERRSKQSKPPTPKPRVGKGFTSSAATAFLPSNPKKLMKRLDILVAEAEAGNPSGMNEASAILDFLKVDKRTYSQILKKFRM